MALVAAGAAALVLSVPLALLGRAALATPGAVARQSADEPAAVQVVAGHRSLAERAAWHLLAADRSEPFAEIVQTYRTVAGLPAYAGQPTWSVRMAHLIPKLRSPSERAQAYVMAGTVLALGAGDGLGIPQTNDSPGARALLAQALDDFRAAVSYDPHSEEAKYDLELLLRQQTAQSAQRSGGEQRKRPVAAMPQPSAAKSKQNEPLNQSRINDAGVYASGSGY